MVANESEEIEGTNSVVLGSLVPGSGLWGLAQDIPEPKTVTIGLSDFDGALELQMRLPEDSLKRKFSWLIQKEPEAHLDLLAAELKSVMTGRHVVLGASFKDRTFLECLEKQGLEHDVVPRPMLSGNDVSLIQREFGLATLTGHGSKSEPRGLVVRHLLEHVYDLGSFFKSVGQIVGESGVVLIEVPDTEPALRNKDFAELWDEHVWYFTEESLHAVVESFGFLVLSSRKCVSEGEHVLFVIAKKVDRPTPRRPKSSASLVLTKAYLAALASERRRSRELTSILKRGLVIYGANHRASNFIDIFLPKDLPVFAVDDDSRKQGLWFSSRAVQITSPAECGAPVGTPVLVALNDSRFRVLLERKPPLLVGADAIGTTSDFSFLYSL